MGFGDSSKQMITVGFCMCSTVCCLILVLWMMLSRVSCVLEPGLLFGSIIAKDCSKLDLGRLVEEVK